MTNSLDRGWDLYHEKAYAAALAELETALRNGADPALAHYRIGNCYIGLGDRERAHEHLSKAVELEPETAVYQLDLGRHIARGGDFKEALPWFARSLQGDALKAMTWHDTAASLGMLGYYELALVCYIVCGVLCDLMRGGGNTGVSLMQLYASMKGLERMLGAKRYSEIQAMMLAKLRVTSDSEESFRLPADAFDIVAAEVAPQLMKIAATSGR